MFGRKYFWSMSKKLRFFGLVPRFWKLGGFACNKSSREYIVFYYTPRLSLSSTFRQFSQRGQIIFSSWRNDHAQSQEERGRSSEDGWFVCTSSVMDLDRRQRGPRGCRIEKRLVDIDKANQRGEFRGNQGVTCIMKCLEDQVPQKRGASGAINTQIVFLTRDTASRSINHGWCRSTNKWIWTTRSRRNFRWNL